MIENKKHDNNLSKVALLVSLACVLQITESLIPHPIPGLRLGLANIVTLIALVSLGFGYALEITILRTLLSSFMMGTFMSPAFILSFSAGLISTLIMGLLYWLSRLSRYRLFSIVGISIAGALLHNLVQLYLAYLILVKHPGIFVFLPWLCIGAVFTGWVTGIIAGKVCCRLEELQDSGEAALRQSQTDCANTAFNNYAHGTSFLHRLPAEIKIAGVFVFSLAALFIKNPWLCAGLFLLLVLIAAVSRVSFAFLFSRTRKYSSLVFTSFLFPLFFNSGSHIVARIAYFKITAEGLNTGILFTWRIIFLILTSALLSKTTSPKELSKGLAKVLLPLRPIGISGTRIAAIMTLSWIAVPVFWEMARGILRKTDFKKAKNIGNLIPLLSEFIVTLYLQKPFFREEVANLDCKETIVETEKVYY